MAIIGHQYLAEVETHTEAVNQMRLAEAPRPRSSMPSLVKEP
jgi:hypothetical protein